MRHFTLIVALTSFIATSPAFAIDDSEWKARGVSERISYITTRSTQILEYKKKRVQPPFMARLERDWLSEVHALETYCSDKFGKQLKLAPDSDDDAAVMNDPAKDEDLAEADVRAEYRRFWHRAEFAEDKMLNEAVPQCQAAKP